MTSTTGDTDTVTNTQEFTFGYHLNNWDLAGLPAEDGLEAIQRNGFRYVEALARDDLSRDFSRRYMGTGDKPVPMGTTDVAFLTRVALFSRAAERGLELSSLYCNREFVNPLSWEYELATMDSITRILAGFGAPGLVLGGGPPARGGADHEPDLYRRFAASLREIGERAGERGMWVAYHPHIDTFIETREQLDRLMNELDDGPAGLCIDIAHLMMAGSDPVAAIRDYASVLKYVHYKDVADQTGISGPARFASFRPLGDGIVDIPAVTAQLLADRYDGIVIIELDSTDEAPEDALKASVAYIESLGLTLRPESSTR
ncbi:sugar phosphate isomerase/epimerase [Glaciihabitans sp. UYNi722]|uniref:sugar phosphate isomerase/epimerase family protein n=1 Tax=Glaciihabitans sp. UYNi722 TaxID=3156344 RepID=UPI003392E3FF